jgi:glycosidase
MFDACRGNGCFGRYFTENDSNDSSPLGPIFPTVETQFLEQLSGIQESYPDDVWKSAFNLLGSHDTNRILFLLKKISDGSIEVARRKLRFLVAFQMTYPGAPSIYYGDEVGVAPEGKWQHNTWIDDPYNRVAFPWADQGLSPIDWLQRDFRALGRMRAENLTLQKGDFQSLEVNNESRMFSFVRKYGSENIIAAFNRRDIPQNLVISKLSGQGIKSNFVEIYPVAGRKYKIQGSVLNLGELDGLDFRILRSTED